MDPVTTWALLDEQNGGNGRIDTAGHADNDALLFGGD